MAKRTEYCGKVSKDLLGLEVTLKGWVQKRRDLGDLIFVDLRDREGIVQIVFNPTFSKEALAIAETIRNEYVIEVKGTVVERDQKVINKNISTGDIEVEVAEIKVLNKSKTTPF
ncbi:MAG: OB-fold nucleic acid binding domain-containing protein [Carnobacterium sp.]